MAFYLILLCENRRMRRAKPSIKIPYKRFEKSFERHEPTSPDDEDGGGIVLKDITVNPASVITSIRPDKPGEEQEPGGGDKKAENKLKSAELLINKNFRTRRTNK
jgi:hypothetical protein